MIKLGPQPPACPLCGSDDLVYDLPEVDGDSAEMRVRCAVCRASWYELFRYFGWRLGRTPPPPAPPGPTA